MAQKVTIGEQKVFPESESLKFSTTPTPQVENPSDSDFSTPIPRLRLHNPGKYYKLPKLFRCSCFFLSGGVNHEILISLLREKILHLLEKAWSEMKYFTIVYECKCYNEHKCFKSTLAFLTNHFSGFVHALTNLFLSKNMFAQ